MEHKLDNPINLWEPEGGLRPIESKRRH